MARPSSETQYRADDLNRSDRWLDSGSGKNPVIHCPQLAENTERPIAVSRHRRDGCFVLQYAGDGVSDSRTKRSNSALTLSRN